MKIPKTFLTQDIDATCIDPRSIDIADIEVDIIDTSTIEIPTSSLCVDIGTMQRIPYALIESMYVRSGGTFPYLSIMLRFDNDVSCNVTRKGDSVPMFVDRSSPAWGKRFRGRRVELRIIGGQTFKVEAPKSVAGDRILSIGDGTRVLSSVGGVLYTTESLIVHNMDTRIIVSMTNRTDQDSKYTDTRGYYTLHERPTGFSVDTVEA